ncbi:MAG: hypothetical protein FWF24_02335 [Alphaproteobacteria bacterium]|nr:hypothetical protein [Alphaproteobacteria bacterium]
MKTKWLLNSFLSLTAASVSGAGAFAQNVSTSATFADVFNTSPDGSAITVMNNITLEDILNRRGLSITISGNTGAEILSLDEQRLLFDPKINQPINITISNLTIDGAIHGAMGLTGGGQSAHQYMISNVTFIDNVTYSNNGFSGNGGAIYINSAGQSNPADFYTIRHSTFINNAATDGGAIYSTIGVNGEKPQGGSTTIAIDGVFTDNVVSNYGGAIYNEVRSGASTVTVDLGSNIYTDNKAVSGGGAIYNAAINDSGVAEETNVLNIADGTQFINNSATYGGAIYNDHQGWINLNADEKGIIFTGDIAEGGTEYGSSIYQATKKGVINLNTANADALISIGGGIGGLGTVNKNGAGILDLDSSSNSAGFLGTFNHTGGTTNVTGVMFGGVNNISNMLDDNPASSVLNITSNKNNIAYNANLFSNVTLNHNFTTMDAVNITGQTDGRSAGFQFMESNATINFLNRSSGQTNYALQTKIDNGQTNFVNFGVLGLPNRVMLGVTDYRGGTVYSFNNTHLDLAYSSALIGTGTPQAYYFSGFFASPDTTLDIAATHADTGDSIVSDELHFAATQDSTINVGKIYIYIKDSAGSPLSGTKEVLFNTGPYNLFFEPETGTQHIANSNYVYTLTVANTPDNSNADGMNSLNFSAQDNLLGNGGNLILNDVNTLDAAALSMGFSTENARAWQIGAGETYYNYVNLGDMAAGKFSVTGNTPGDSSAVLSGYLLNANGQIQPDAQKGSLFRVTEDGTDFSMDNLTIRDAYTVNNGAALVMLTPDSSVTLNKMRFEDNIAYGNGGAMDIELGIVSITNVDFFNNKALTGSGGAILQCCGMSFLTNNNFTGNEAAQDGGAIYYNGTDISTLSTTINNFTGNTAGRNGGAVYNVRDLAVGGGSTFTGNIAGENGGAIYSEGTLFLTSEEGSSILFSSNTAAGKPNDIYTTGDIQINGSGGTVSIENGIAGSGTIEKTGAGILAIGGDNSDFTGTYTQTAGTLAVSGTFFGGDSTISDSTLVWLDGAEKLSTSRLFMDSGVLLIYGGDLKLDNPDDFLADAVHYYIMPGAMMEVMAGNSVTFDNADVFEGTVVLSNGTVTFDEAENTLSYGSAYKQTGGTMRMINGSIITLNPHDEITGGDIEITHSTLNASGNTLSVGSDSSGVSVRSTGGNLTMNHSYFNAEDNVISANSFAGDFTATGINYFKIDIDGKQGISDSWAFSGKFSDGGADVSIVDVSDMNFITAPTQKELYLPIFTASSNDPVTFVTSTPVVETPIGKYDFSSLGDGLYLLRFLSPSAQALRGQVATQSVYSGQQLLNNTLFDHVYLDSNERIETRFAPWQFLERRSGWWAKGYGAHERRAFNQDIGTVNNNIYGAVIGLDMPSAQLNDTWRFLPTFYAAYNGGHQKYDDVSMSQNGGQAGFMGTISDGDFISSIMGYVGGYQNRMKVAGYQDNLGNWFAGLIAKSAYNIHVANNFVIQPSALISYNFYGRQKWDSDYGSVAMETSSLNGASIGPGLAAIYDGGGWNSHASVLYMQNIGTKVSGKAGDIDLPRTGMRNGYFEYGLGAARQINEALSFEGKATLRNGDGTQSYGGHIGAIWKF